MLLFALICFDQSGMLLGGRGVVHRGQLKLLYPNVASEAQDYKGKRKWPS